MHCCSLTLVIAVAILVITFLIIKKIFGVSKITELKKKHVVVTGGSSGIGKSVAIAAARLGADVTIIARDKRKLELALEDIRNSAKPENDQIFKSVSLDVSKEFQSIEETINSLEVEVGPIFLLVNCAGSAICGEIDCMTENDFRYMMDLNYFGTVFPTMAVAKKMKERGDGHIVITGSQGSLLGIYGMSAYCSSKFALRGFAESLHMELKPYNVKVTLSLPPDTNTPGFQVEEKSKPEITKLISETAGLFDPNTVANQLLSDSMDSKFFSIVGFESFILTTLCSGMSPLSSWVDTILQILSMSLLKLISVGYLLHFQKIINNYTKNSEKVKKN